MGDETAKSEERPSDGKTGAERGRPDRAGLITGAAVLAVCGGLVLYGVLSPDGEEKKERHVPTASVTYEVTGTGTADITYQARSESGKATVVKAASLPWRKTVPVPLGRSAVVNVVLGEKGGEARCAVAVQGRHLQSATASGNFGRATCTGALPSAGPSPDPADAAAG
ncbi:MmpS family transport accessory protein [Streptomyces sp. NPDC001595]|uniref:MmpS family transport accessory protein n=1 Tax=Streptomyces sp. NPDC001532 TaxID=3154520 RepID=UPI003333D5E1